jgi:hypothetical protein
MKKKEKNYNQEKLKILLYFNYVRELITILSLLLEI